MYYPFRKEYDIKFCNPPTYANKLRQANVIELVNQNHLKVELFETIVNHAFERFNSELETNMDSFGQQQNNETYDQQSQQFEESDTDNCSIDFTEIENQTRYADATSRQTPLFSYGMINENIRSLIKEQQKVFDILQKWSKDFTKNLGSNIPQTINPLHIFITGNRIWKSHLIKTIHMSFSKVLMYKGGDPKKPRILLLVPNGGVAAVHTNRKTIYCGLQINIGDKMSPLNDLQLAILRKKLSDFNIMIIDGI